MQTITESTIYWCIDRLTQSEGKLLSDKLQKSNVDTDYELYSGVTHKFFGMAAVVPQAKEAQALAAKKLKAAFSK